MVFLGSGFTGMVKVYVGSKMCSITSLTAEEIKCTGPAGTEGSPSTQTVKVLVGYTNSKAE